MAVCSEEHFVERVPLEPISRYLDVEVAEDLESLLSRVPGAVFTCYHPHGKQYAGFIDDNGRPWLREDDGGEARQVLEVIDPPFRISYPLAPALSIHDESQVRCSVLHTIQELEDYRAGFARTGAGVDAGHRAYALDGRGRHWLVMVSATVTTVVASRVEIDEHGEAHAVTVPFDAERLSLPITVVEID